MSRQKLLMGIILVLIGSIAILNLYAVNTAYWNINDNTSIRKGDFENLVMTADGNLILGKTVSKIDTKEPSIWSSVRTKKGDVYLGSGSGKIYKLADKKLDEIFSTGEMLITSMLVSDNNEIFAATIPKGKIFKIDTVGKVTGTLFSTLPSGYVWSLTYGPNNQIMYAATGPDGKIYEIDQKGKAKIFYDTKKTNILSMIFDGKDHLYFGTANPGLLYRISFKGKPEVIADFGDTELKSLFCTGKELYIAVNNGTKVTPQDFLNAVQAAATQPEKSSQQPPPPPKKSEIIEEKTESTENPPAEKPAEEPAQPTSPPPEQPKALVQSSIYKITPDGLTKEIIMLNNCYLTDIKVNNKGEIFAGTDNSGKIFHIDTEGKFSIPFDFEANQVLTFLLDKDDNLDIIGTGGPGAIYQVNNKDAQKGNYLSEVFDAKFVAKWGNFNWKGKGKLSFQSRSGNTAKPDETWGDWSEEKTVSAGEWIRPISPATRYFQFKLIWGDNKEAKLEQTALAYLINNQPPKITNFMLGDANPAAPVPQPGQPMPPLVPHSPTKKITWQTADSDGDLIGYHLYYKKEDQKNWILLSGENLIFVNEFNWDTVNLPDGKYQIKIQASDENCNPPDRVLRDEKISLPILIDNTKPEISELKINKMVCSGKVTDNLGPIRQIQYSINGNEWRLIYPKDNLLDDRVEEFEFLLPELKKGSHTIMLYGFDEAGNLGVAQQEFEVK